MLFEEAFHVEITNKSGGTWRVYMFQAPSIDEGKVYLYTQKPGEDILTLNKSLQTLVENESCSAPVTDGSTSINFRDAEAGGEPCEDLEFYEEEIVGEQHNISFKNTKSTQLGDATAEEIVTRFDEEGRSDELENALSTILGVSVSDPTAQDVQDAWSDVAFTGDRVTGKYEIVVDTEHSTTTESNFYSTDSGEPSSRTIVFSADTKMVYRSGDASLTTDGVEVKWSVADS